MVPSPPAATPTPNPSPRRVEAAPTALWDGERVRSWTNSGRIAAAAFMVFVAVAVLASVAFAQPKFPALTGRIVDEAGLLTAADKVALEQELKALEDKSTDQLVIYVARSLQGYEIEDFGYKLGRTWAIGHKDKNNGVVLIVAPKERKVRIEVGRGLEPQLTDVMSKLIIENAILPAFRRGDFPAGIKAGVRDIRDVLLGDAEAVKQRAKRAAPRSPGGSGGGFALAMLILFILVAFTMVWMQSQQTAHPSRAVRDRRRSRAARQPADWGSSSSGWSGGGSSDSGGGGFSGGGGDFGGGGSSGSW
jgi:uncharacterized protein